MSEVWLDSAEMTSFNESRQPTPALQLGASWAVPARPPVNNFG